MEDTKLYRIVRRLRPELDTIEGGEQLQAYMEMLPTLYTAPLALVGLIWLLVATRWDLITTFSATFGVLTVTLLLIERQPFNIAVKLSGGSTTVLSSSLAPLVVWTGMFIFGPTALWSPVVVALISTAWLSWQRMRLNQNAVWHPLSLLSQDVTTTVLVYLIALAVYGALGGSYPLTEFNIDTVLPALAAILIGAILPTLLLLPTIVYANRLTGSDATFASLKSFFANIVAIIIVIAPFAILVAIIYGQNQLTFFTCMLIGIVLVNALAHYLSQARERSEQRSRELTRLEELSEAIIQMPPAAAPLETLLKEHAPRMFSADILEIKLGNKEEEDSLDSKASWRTPVFEFVYPQSQKPENDVVWDELQWSKGSYRLLSDVVLPGAAIAFGDAIAVKIYLMAPGQEESAGECIGGIYLLRSKQLGRVIDALPSVQALASQIGAALYRAQVHEATLAHERVRQELAFAGRIQASFLPHEVPKREGWDISATLIPARETSGDFYDFIPLDDNRLGVLVADVADKGTGAALYMAMSRTIIRTFAQQFQNDPALVLWHSNQRILSDTQSDQFVTVFYAVLDLESGELIYCSAGHNPAYLLSPQPDSEPAILKRTGIPLGVFEDMAWEQKRASMHSGDRLLIYSDGVTEAQNLHDELFAEGRLLAAGRVKQRGSAKEIEVGIIASIRDFVGEAPQYDDITLMVVVRA
ncbi:MAG: PP2C family protein-serine/threonine phosphatase [Chloroflexi bacterium]|nr:PP2C family protein-serine/threonine phosphatase [Chloroflexota bacterium]